MYTVYPLSNYRVPSANEEVSLPFSDTQLKLLFFNTCSPINKHVEAGKVSSKEEIKFSCKNKNSFWKSFKAKVIMSF